MTKAEYLASAKTCNAVVSLSSCDRRLAAAIDQWDADPRLLNTPGGVIDLRTGTARPHDPLDFMTKITAVAPWRSPTPTFDAFFDRVTGRDRDLQAYLKRMSGYCLTGLTSEHALFFIYGLGGNGKSVFIDTLSGILGDYHTTAPMETFTATTNERHPTELAGLRGARMVTAVETEDGHRWAESKIKSLTGGDKISARYMRQDFFTFTPQLKLIIAGNHQPSLRSVDEAMRRRFNLIPFEVTIPEEDRDKDLKDKLRTEWPGILAWMIDGCLEWQASGLSPPSRVQNATAEYLEGEDKVGAWLEECCVLRADAWTPTGALFSSWSEWAQGRGEFVGSAGRLGRALAARGYKPLLRDARGWCGLQLKPSDFFSSTDGAHRLPY